jgi:hypothetical protein
LPVHLPPAPPAGSKDAPSRCQSKRFEPPHTIIFDPVKTAEWEKRGEGAPLVLMAVQVFEAGS